MNLSLSARYTLPQHTARNKSGLRIVLGKCVGPQKPEWVLPRLKFEIIERGDVERLHVLKGCEL